MALLKGPRLKIIRRLGIPLPGLMKIKEDLRKPYPPGQHGPTKRTKLSDYALRLREKQKIRFHYGLSEKQLKKYIKKAFKNKKNPGIILLSLLERRLDNIIFRAGFSPTIKSSRQLTGHGHIYVNNNKVDIPSFELKIGDKITVNRKSKMLKQVLQNIKNPLKLTLPEYLENIDSNALTRIIKIPTKSDIPITINEQLIIEFYSGL